MPFPKEHAARMQAPGKYAKIRRKNNHFGPGVHVLFGVTKAGKAEVQSIHFDKSKFTPAQAKAWLKSHKHKAKSFEKASGPKPKANKEKLVVNTNVFHRFTANLAPLLKEQTKNDKTYLVGPVVLAKECVMNGLFYPAEELRKFTAAWNDRIVPVFHPEGLDGKPISANTQEVIAEHAVGRLYDVYFDESAKALKGDVWLEKDRIGEVSPRLQEILAGNGHVDVSTGLFLDQEPTAGMFEGHAYSAIARNYRPDHLALLPDQPGACTWAEGAGFPRVNKKEEDGEVRHNARRVVDIAMNLIGNEESHNELRQSIRAALKAALPNSMVYVEDVFDKYVIYEVEPREVTGVSIEAGTSPVTKLFKRDYTVGSDDVVVLADITVPVERKVVYEPVAPPTTNQDGDTEDTNEGGSDMDRAERIEKLLANEQLEEKDRETLEEMSDTQFDLFEKQFVANKDPADDEEEKPKPKEGDKAADEGTKEEATSKKEEPAVNKKEEPEPEHIVHGRKMFEQRKAKLIERITANKRNTFSADELKEMPYEALEKLGKLAVEPNFAGRFVQNEEDEEVTENAASEALPLPGLSMAAASK